MRVSHEDWISLKGEGQERVRSFQGGADFTCNGRSFSTDHLEVFRMNSHSQTRPGDTRPLERQLELFDREDGRLEPREVKFEGVDFTRWNRARQWEFDQGVENESPF